MQIGSVPTSTQERDFVSPFVLFFINLIGPNLERDIEGAFEGRFPDLAQDNFGTGLVHLSYYLTEPVADPS